MSKAYAQESQGFVLHCISAWSQAGVDAFGIPKEDPLFGSPTNASSAVIAPDTRIITPEENPHENLLIVDLDLNLITTVKQVADTSGHCEQFQSSKRIDLVANVSEYRLETGSPLARRG